MTRVALLALLVLVAFAGVVAAHEHDGEHGGRGDHGDNEHENNYYEEGKRVFAIFGGVLGSTRQQIDGGFTADWGRLGGEGGEAFPATRYDPNDPNKCPNNLQDPFYISIDPKIDNSGGPFDKLPNDPCVVAACGSLDGDVRENCEGKIQQLQAAYVLERSCKHKGCEFIINTSDNFYALGCNSTDHSSGPKCASRFQSDWLNVYKTKYQPALRHLTWYGSLGNHDVLGGIEGVDDQIAYTDVNEEWYLPARYYAKRIGSGPTAINLIVAHTSVFIDGYLDPTSDYSKIDEEQAFSKPDQRAKQLAFLEKALKAASKKSGWTIVVGHHPAFSGDQSYFRDDDAGKPESDAWATFAALVKKYQPHFYVNGHDHAINYFNAGLYGYTTQFFTSGAGSFTEPNDGGWDKTTGAVRTTKPYLKYSNVRMADGASFTGNIVATATADTLKAEMFSAPSGNKPQFIVECTKGRRYDSGFKCTYGPGPAAPAYSQP